MPNSSYNTNGVRILAEEKSYPRRKTSKLMRIRDLSAKTGDPVRIMGIVVDSSPGSAVIQDIFDDVKKADTAGLQLFVALARDVSNTGGALVWKRPSQPLIDAARLLGLEKELGLV